MKRKNRLNPLFLLFLLCSFQYANAQIGINNDNPSTSFDPGFSDQLSGAFGYCRNLVHNGHSDWRLPTLSEAESPNNISEFGNSGNFQWTTAISGEGTGNGRKNMLYRPSQDERKLLEIDQTHEFRCVR